ncbi:hypothetical protein ES703_97502 [subsurface metagenome]
MNKFIVFWLPVLVWAGFIFWLSSIPDLKTDLEQDFLLRKIAHILEYAILCFLLIRALVKEKLSNKKIAIYSIIFAIFYALSDEYHQTFIQGRQGSFKDIGINSVGILLMAWLWYYKSRRIKGR